MSVSDVQYDKVNHNGGGYCAHTFFRRLFLHEIIEVVQKDPLIGIGAALTLDSSTLIEPNKYNCCVWIVSKLSLIMNIVKIS